MQSRLWQRVIQPYLFLLGSVVQRYVKQYKSNLEILFADAKLVANVPLSIYTWEKIDIISIGCVLRSLAVALTKVARLELFHERHLD